jgi:hypothetical protein
MAESRQEASQSSQDLIPDTQVSPRILHARVMEPMRFVREEPTPKCISANAKLNIDEAMLGYFGCHEKFQILSTTPHWKIRYMRLRSENI